MELTKLNKTDSSTSDRENSDEQILLKKLFKSLFDIPALLTNNGIIIEKINNIQDQVIKEGVVDSESETLLQCTYEMANREVMIEAKSLNKMLEIIYEVRNIREQKIKSLLRSQGRSTSLKLLQITATKIPVWFSINDETPPPLCGAIEPLMSYVAKSGDLVAALVKQSGDERWIAAEAIAFKNGKYEVEDIDEEEINRKFTLDKKFVKPLPLMRADPVSSPGAFFHSSQFVLAMYPKTTCFFKALVKAPPKTSNDGYEVLFEDDDSQYTNMLNVSQRFVISYPSSELKNDMNVMKNDINVMKNDMNVMKNHMTVMKNDMNVMKNDMNVMMKNGLIVMKNDMYVTKIDMNVTKNDMICKDNMKCLHI